MVEFTDDEEERIRRIGRTLGRWSIKRKFELKESRKVVRDEFQRFLMLFDELATHPHKLVLSSTTEIKFEHDYRNKEYQLYEIIEESINIHNIDEVTNEQIKDMLDRNSFYSLQQIKDNMTNSHKFFHSQLYNWKLTYNKSEYSDFEPNEIEKHLSGLLLGYYLYKNEERFPEEKEKIKESILRQLSTYIRTGSLDFVEEKDINLEEMDYPKPMLFLSDYRDSLVWKHKRYCPICGKSSSMCYCENIDDEITDEMMIDDYPCWDCYREGIKRGFKEDYNDEYDEEMCKELMNQFLEPFLETEENFEPMDMDREDIIDEDWNFKKIEDDDKIQYLIDEVNMFYSEIGAVDCVDTCSCPNW